MTRIIPGRAPESDAPLAMEPHSNPTPVRDPFASFRADHARVLARMTELERTVLSSPGEQLDEVPLHDLVAHLGHQFPTHMAAEDAELFPALTLAFPEVRGALAPLRADHIELRGMLVALVALLPQRRTAARDEQLRVLTRDLVDLLRLHIHKEEAVVFDLAARVLRADEVEALGRRIAPYLRTHQDAVIERREGEAS